MTKSELIERVAEAGGLTKSRAELVINTVFDYMVEALAQGDGIEIRGFGSFSVRQYKAYEGRNPRTGETVRVPPKRLPFFKVGKDLRERINGRHDSSPPPPLKSPAGTRKPKTAGGRRKGSAPDDTHNEDVI